MGHDSVGIFSLLDNESKMRAPSTLNFMNAIIGHHSRKPEIKLNKPSDFTIRHFAGDVVYSTVRHCYISKNQGIDIFVLIGALS